MACPRLLLQAAKPSDDKPKTHKSGSDVPSASRGVEKKKKKTTTKKASPTKGKTSPAKLARFEYARQQEYFAKEVDAFAIETALVGEVGDGAWP